MSEFDIVTGLGYGIITFAMVIGVGLIIMTKFGGEFLIAQLVMLGIQMVYLLLQMMLVV